ncbi:MAG: hypothetical protein HUJ51_04835 [Eggerthellaceae bacterium]|nr:hypothetical protein [Eggerthellaceae bacterium]
MIEDYAGMILSDIFKKRGRVMGTKYIKNSKSIIIVRAPYVEGFEYTKDLR